jgi:hypothetical protein
MGCARDEVARRISDCLTELARTKDRLNEYAESAGENSLLRAKNASLEQRLAFANEQIEGMGRRMEMFRSGKDSEVVNQIHADFLKLKTVNSELYNEHLALQDRLFQTERSLSQTTATLQEQQNANADLTERLGRYEFYELSVGQLAGILSELSSRMVSSLSANRARHRHLEAVDALVVGLRRQSWSAEQSPRIWSGFGEALFELLTEDHTVEIQSLLRHKLNDCVAMVLQWGEQCKARIMDQEKRITEMAAKAAQPQRPPPRSRLAVLDRVVKRSPAAPPKKFAERSPLTPSGQAFDGIGLTPRLNPTSVFEPSLRRFV